MGTVKVSSGGQVRIPKEIMEKLHISTGDYIDFEYRGDTVVLRAKKLIDAEQAWFWEKGWQEAERKAEEDIRQGRVSEVFESPEEGMAHLRKRRKKLRSSKKKG